ARVEVEIHPEAQLLWLAKGDLDVLTDLVVIQRGFVTPCRPLNQVTVRIEGAETLSREGLDSPRGKAESERVLDLFGREGDRQRLSLARPFPQQPDSVPSIGRGFLDAVNRAVAEEPNRVEDSRFAGPVPPEEHVDRPEFQRQVGE